MSRRARCVVLACIAGAMAGEANAQGYPAKPVRWVVSFPPGGSVDGIARRMGPPLANALGQQVVIDNRVGASGNIASELVARAAPDGYTLLSHTVPFVVNTFLYSRVPYHPVNDFAPVTLLGTTASLVSVHPSVPVRTVKELVALARARPGALNYGSAGVGTNPHISGELLNHLAKINMVAVQYKGGRPAVMATISGETSLTITSVLEAAPQVQAGRLRAIAVTSRVRSPALPQIPTIEESGVPGYEFLGWHALFAPRGTPAAITNLLRDKLKSAVGTPEVTQQLQNQGLDLVLGTPDELGVHVQAEMAKWGTVIRERGMRAD
jgi:tripartite-type tricarboxylate transporter receptor subunit TctC